VSADPTSSDSPTEAMATAAKLVQDDLALMIENDGELHNRVGLARKRC
jgi:hypothetical protein